MISSAALRHWAPVSQPARPALLDLCGFQCAETASGSKIQIARGVMCMFARPCDVFKTRKLNLTMGWW